VKISSPSRTTLGKHLLFQAKVSLALRFSQIKFLHVLRCSALFSCCDVVGGKNVVEKDVDCIVVDLIGGYAKGCRGSCIWTDVVVIVVVVVIVFVVVDKGS